MSRLKAVAKAPHLASWPLPAWLDKAIDEIGTAEVPGPKSNARIMDYRRMAGVDGLSGEDSVVPWCAIFVNAMLDAAGVAGTGNAMARGFVKHPEFMRLETPVVGCITVISSSRGPSSGHVFFYIGEDGLEDGLFVQGLGGNQDDQVSIAKFPKAKLVGYFWPKKQPLPPAPFNQPVRLARPSLPHEKAVRDA